MNIKFPDKETLPDLIITEVSMILQLFGGWWLYGKITGTGEPGFGFFGYIAGAWAVVAIIVLLHDLAVCYLLFNKAGMQHKLLLNGRLSQEQAGLFFISFALFMVLSLPVVIYRINKDL